MFPWMKRRLYELLQKGSIYCGFEIMYFKSAIRKPFFLKLLLQSNIYTITPWPMGITTDLKREPKCLPGWITWNLHLITNVYASHEMKPVFVTFIVLHSEYWLVILIAIEI